MDPAEALAELRAVAVETLAVAPEAVTSQARFREDLDAGSLDIIEFVMALEDRLGRKFPEGELSSITTVGQAVDLILELESDVR
jgi:acyl carrier protein